MKIESGYDKVWKAGCRECNYLNFGCGHHEEKPTECAELSLKVDARIEELERILKRAYELGYIDGDWVSDYHKIIGG